MFAAGRVRADELADFEAARSAYDEQHYDDAVRLFERLVGGEVPTITNDLLILECRKYLAAGYLFVQRRADAEAQFEALLRADPGYELDPLAFSSEVLDVFRSVGDRLSAEAARTAAEQADREAERRREQADRLLREQERIDALEALASLETVERVNSRWVAALPFGVGQFQNRDNALGMTLLVTEAVLLATSGVSFVLHNSLRDETPSEADMPRARQLEESFRVTNWVSTGVLAAALLGGVIDAQIRFVPVYTTTRQRRLPDNTRPSRPDSNAGASVAEPAF